MALGDVFHIVVSSDGQSKRKERSDHMLTLYTDGGARGNPGPAAVAYAIFDQGGRMVEKGGEFIGTRTNNEAEYEALLLGLERVRQRGGCTGLIVVSDSELMVRQITGRYKVKEERLRRYTESVAANARLFESFEIVHARREDPGIQLVDELVNTILEQKGYPKRR